MAAYRLKHLATGTYLQGYEVLEATAAEIRQANQRLKQQKHAYRFVPFERQPAPAVGTLVDERLPAPCPVSQPAP